MRGKAYRVGLVPHPTPLPVTATPRRKRRGDPADREREQTGLAARHREHPEGKSDELSSHHLCSQDHPHRGAAARRERHGERAGEDHLLPAVDRQRQQFRRVRSQRAGALSRRQSRRRRATRLRLGRYCQARLHRHRRRRHSRRRFRDRRAQQRAQGQAGRNALRALARRDLLHQGPGNCQAEGPRRAHHRRHGRRSDRELSSHLRRQCRVRQQEDGDRQHVAVGQICEPGGKERGFDRRLRERGARNPQRRKQDGARGRAISCSAITASTTIRSG